MINVFIKILQGMVIVIGYGVTVATSGLVVRHFIGATIPRTEDEQSDIKSRYEIGTIIGKCENLLTITFILANAFTGLALIFIAKSVVRSDVMKKDPEYYITGTLVNFTYSVLMGFLIRSIFNYFN